MVQRIILLFDCGGEEKLRRGRLAVVDKSPLHSRRVGQAVYDYH